MLTVIRELAEEAEARPHAELEPAALLKQLVGAARTRVARTPEQLDVLREAGVVDAGGAGLLELVRGIAPASPASRCRRRPPDATRLGIDAIHLELSRYRYCTVFVVEGEALDAAALEDELERLGDSLLVVGDPSALKVHVHTDDPGAALALGDRAPASSSGSRSRTCTSRRPSAKSGSLAVAPDARVDAGDRSSRSSPGPGNRRLFESFGATRVSRAARR